MSLSPISVLKPREHITEIQDSIKHIDPQELFKKVIGMDLQKRIICNGIYADDPVHFIIVGPPGNGKTLFLECIRDAFQYQSCWGDTVTSSGIGVIEEIISMGNRLRFLLIDEIEKFHKNDRHAFLALLARGNISRKLAKRNIEIKGLKVWFLATCNDYEYMQKYEKAFVNRCQKVEIPALPKETYFYVASKVLRKEKGIHSEEIGKYIAQRVYAEFGQEPDIRRAIAIARMSNAHAIRTRLDDTINEDVVDEVVADFVVNRMRP